MYLGATRFDAHSEDRSSLTLRLNSNKIVVQAEPFRMDLIVDGELVMSVNARGLLKFEINRNKVQQPEKP